jgi:CRISPR-associated protein Csc3
MQPLKDMAKLAVEGYIKGRSYKRNSILKPLDIILDNLEREPKEDVRELVQSASKRQIFDHLQAIAGAEYTMGKSKPEKVSEYVDVFFEQLLNEFHKGDVNRLLQRIKLIRSAYLLYFYNALPEPEKKEAAKQQ